VGLDAEPNSGVTTLAGENERLQDARDPPVPIAEWMDGHEVKVRHRGADDDLASRSPVASTTSPIKAATSSASVAA
jgi:hypothetical protein